MPKLYQVPTITKANDDDRAPFKLEIKLVDNACIKIMMNSFKGNVT